MSLALYGKNATQSSLQIGSLDAIVFEAGGIVQGLNTPVARQSVQTGNSAAGVSSFLQAGSGLNLNLLALATPLKTNFAAGLRDYVSTLSYDRQGIVNGLPVNAVSYISQDYASQRTVNWGFTQAPPQYGVSYNQGGQSCLQFGGAALSTTFLDDFGPTWTPVGGARVQTNQFKFGTGALGGAGTNNALNGTSDYLRSTSFTSLGGGSWSMRCWFNATAVSSATFQTVLMAGQTASGYGVSIGIASSKMSYYLSSTATSWDISSAGVGAATLVLGTWNFAEIVYDAVAGKYFGYLNGALDYTVTSALKICPTQLWTLGSATTAGNYFGGYIDKFEFLPYCQHPNGIGYAVPTQAPNVATQGYAADFFSIPLMTMFQVSGPSPAAGYNPVFTPKNRVYVGQATTNLNAVSNVVSYALNGVYDSGWFAIAAATQYAKAHNIGVTPSYQYSWGSLDAFGNTQGQWMYALNNSAGTAGGGGWLSNATPLSITLYGDNPPRFSAGGTYNLAAYARMVISRGW